MSDLFIDLAQRGKNSWWRYAIGAVFSLLMLTIVGSTMGIGLLSLYVSLDNNPLTKVASPEAIEAGKAMFIGVSPLLLYVESNVGFLFHLLGIWLSVRLLHQRGLKSLITPYTRVNWKRIAQGFGVFAVLKVLEAIASYAIAPQDFVLSFQLVPFLMFLPLVLLITPLQTTAEELFFRGYLLQGLGTGLGKWPAVILTSVIFASMHLGGPEATSQSSWVPQAMLAIHIAMIAVFLAWITLKDKTLELAIGVHAANNIVSFLFVTGDADITSIPAPAIFTISKMEVTFASLFITALTLLAFSFVIFRMVERPASPVASLET